ncbi:MAG: hypothetical protein E7474_12925 [Ruminococcaceae bacterium]|nr:hypothetical protein [Oscillospiraceae bacterium]
MSNEDQIVQNQLQEIRNRLDYAKRNINSHMLEDPSLSGKIAIDGIVLSIVRNAKDSLTMIYRQQGINTAAMEEAFKNVLETCDSRNCTYADRKDMIDKLKSFTNI